MKIKNNHQVFSIIINPNMNKIKIWIINFLHKTCNKIMKINKQQIIISKIQITIFKIEIKIMKINYYHSMI